MSEFGIASRIFTTVLFASEPIPKQPEESGIWQGGAPDFSFRASGSANRHGASAGRKIWSEADNAKNRFFRLFGYSIGRNKTCRAPHPRRVSGKPLFQL